MLVVKLHEIERVIDHYEPDMYRILDDNVVDMIYGTRQWIGSKEMFDKYVYKFLNVDIYHWSTKLTSWSWNKLYSDRKKGYGYRRKKIKKNLIRMYSKSNVILMRVISSLNVINKSVKKMKNI